jgi:hypothetical protein
MTDMIFISFYVCNMHIDVKNSHFLALVGGFISFYPDWKDVSEDENGCQTRGQSLCAFAGQRFWVWGSWFGIFHWKKQVW